MMIALTSSDQLRQRVAWALAQLLVVVKSSISVQLFDTEIFLQYYDFLSAMHLEIISIF